MRIASLISRYLLALIFLFFGLNGLFHFLPVTMPPGTAGQFLSALFTSHYVSAVAIFQILGGALLLIRRYLPLGLIILGPIIVNILLFHTFMEPSGLPLALITALLWVLAAMPYRAKFARAVVDSGTV